MRYLKYLLIFICQIGFCQVKSPIICGHRGGFYSAYPENSLAVIDYVKKQVNDQQLYLEVDIRQSKDGTLYILHDESVDRTTNGSGNIAELSDAYIDQLFLKNASGKLSGERILKLSDLLIALKESKILLMLDIKGNAWKETAQLILKNKWASKSLFLTFKPEDTQQVIAVSKQLYVSALVRNEEDWKSISSIQSVSIAHLVAYLPRDASTDFVSHLKTQGLKTMADVSEHTTNQGKLYSKEYYQNRIANQKLDILITDFPIEVSSVIK